MMVLCTILGRRGTSAPRHQLTFGVFSSPLSPNFHKAELHFLPTHGLVPDIPPALQPFTYRLQVANLKGLPLNDLSRSAFLTHSSRSLQAAKHSRLPLQYHTVSMYLGAAEPVPGPMQKHSSCEADFDQLDLVASLYSLGVLSSTVTLFESAILRSRNIIVRLLDFPCLRCTPLSGRGPAQRHFRRNDLLSGCIE